jgi:Fe-S oxidoreductase
MPLQDPIVTLENCRFCLMCTHVAPVGFYTRLETYSPHGMALLATSEERLLIDWDEETVEIMFSEVDGGNSRAHCVFSQPFEESIAAMRARLADAGLAPDSAIAVQHRLISYGNPYREEAPQQARGQGEYALFVGDAAPYLWPTAVPAALDVLSSMGIEPALIGNGRNSGLLAHSLGYPELGRELAQATLDELQASGAKTLLVLSAGDAYALTGALEERLDLTLPEGVEVVELTAFLADSLALDNDGQEDVPRTAYIDPTHAVRLPGREEAPRALAAAKSGGELVELFWRRDRAHPVGSTYLQFTNPTLAETLTRARLEDAKRNGARRLLCDDPATLYQLQRFADDYDLQVAGLYETLAA